MASTSKGKVMEKTAALQDQHQRQLPLNCPRCDSSNTKFCYYNNYSLSQPRHFCKACKRYWTRGGTLRNVPVGGGCRKNKRVQRPAQPSNGGGEVISAAGKSTATTSPTSNHINNSMFYSLPTNYPGLNFPFCNGFDIQMNGLGLGFVQKNEFKDGFNPVKKIEGVVGTSNSSVAIDPILLLANSNFQGLMPCDGMKVPDENVVEEKEYKIEGQNRLDWFDSSSSSSVLWNTSNAGSWFDPSNVGSSVHSLI